MLQLAIAEEFGGELRTARAWYDKVAGKFSKTEAGARATGAIRRLDLVGKPFRFSASGLGGGTVNASNYRGKVLLVVFWSTWCKPCTEDLPQILELYKQYRSSGFEIVGINLDVTTDPIAGYLKEHKVTWQQVYEPGGLDSRPAREFGIISLPTMFVIDKTGKTIASNIAVDELKKQLPELLKK
jgi:thiol-disulfide isomerase/thioredoxin